jgi:carboxypeptidase C (cathepsin A)
MTMYYKDWNKDVQFGTTGEHLRNAMTRRPGMRTFFANGWYDLCTEFGHVYYTLDHAGLPKDRVFVKGYKSGHMIYIGEENTKELSRDIRTFILGGKPE